MEYFSILNPNQNNSEVNKPLFTHVFSELKIKSIVIIKPAIVSGKMTTFNLEDFLTTDTETINHRLDIFEDLQNSNGLFELLKDNALPAICEISSMTAGFNDDEMTFIDRFISVKQLNTYVQLIQKMHESFATLTFKSAGLRNFANKIASIYTSDEFSNLQPNLKKLNAKLEKNIRSVTVGINIDHLYNVTSLGIVSINEERYKSVGLINKLIGQSSGDPFTLITPIERAFKNSGAVTTDEKHELMRSFRIAMGNILKDSVKNIPRDITAYMRSQTQFLLSLASEISFLVAGHEMIAKLKQLQMPVCKPVISQTNHTHIKDLYHPILLDTTNSEELIKNSISFDDDGMIYTLTGANSGGKSVFLHSLGIAQILFQLGLYIPAGEAVMHPVDNLCIHLPTETVIQHTSGRLEQECKAFNETLKIATSKSLVLVDEAFSSTGAYDGSILAEELLKHFAKLGCRCIFSTHIHDLPVERINQNSAVKVDTLVAVSIDGKRMYKISRQKPDGKSHARDIAKKYGLLIETEE